jgi:hypothetical protein
VASLHPVKSRTKRRFFMTGPKSKRRATRKPALRHARPSEN